MRFSLFTRYWASLAALVTVPIVAVGMIESWNVYRSHYQSALDRQALAARAAALIVEGAVRPPIERLYLIAALPWGYPSATGDEFVKESRRVIRQFPLIERIQRVDHEGHIRADFSQTGRVRELDPGEKKQLRVLMGNTGVAADRGQPPTLTGSGDVAAARQVGIAVPISRTRKGEWSVAVLESDGTHAVVADLRADTVNKLVTGVGKSEGQLVFIVDRAGVVLAHPDISLVHAAQDLRALHGWSDVNGLEQALVDRGPAEGSLGEIAVRVSNAAEYGGEWFAAYRRVQPIGWTVFALSPSGEWHAQIRSAVARSALILLSANALALLLALALARQMSRPLESLSRASQRVARGDLSARAAVLSDDDIGRVSRQFNTMVDELRTSYGQLEQRVAEKTVELERANRHKSEFLTQISHELRTPLNAVIGFSDALKAQYFGPLNDKQREYIEQILASGQHLLALINDLLDLAKIEAGRMDLALGMVDVAAVVRSAVVLVQRRADMQRITIEQDVRIRDGWVADERKVMQVLVNLLSNAVKFTPSSGRIRVAVDVSAPGDRRPRELQFAVSDNGIGIPPDQVARLFTDFGQIVRDDTTIREGTGLGLALSRRLVELHGGSIWAESEPGRGSTFYFTLPERPWPENRS